ncbi:hypothetical protein ABPG74_008146 [Tetrahymena malaccensis]
MQIKQQMWNYLIVITILECVITQKSQQNQSQSTNYKVLNLYEINQIRQTNNTQNMILNLSKDGQQAQSNNSFLVIDIDLTITQTFQTSFIACLNFNYDILQDTQFQNAGAYSCQYMDSNATQQQINQHLIVIKTSDQVLKNNSKAYLTIFYLESPDDFLSQSQQLKNPIDYVVVTYYSSWYPCHNNCNNLNGSCDQKTGQCQCMPLYFNIDCSLQANSLNLIDNNNQVDITIYQQKTQFFFINLTQTISNNNYGHLTLQFNQINQIAKIDILINVNQLNLPSDSQNNEKYIMSNQMMQIQNLDLLCSKYDTQNVNQKGIVNGGDTQIKDQCFLLLAIQQTMSQSQFSLVEVQLQFQTSSTNNNGDDSKNQTSQQSSKSQSQQLNQVQITIILVCSLGGMCFLIILLRVLKSKLKATNQNRNITINNLQNEVLAYDFFDFINTHAQKDKIKQLVMQKKRILQEYFMPTILFQSNTQQSLNKIEAQQNNIISQSKIQNEQNYEKEQNNKSNQVQTNVLGQIISPTQEVLIGFKANHILQNNQAGIQCPDEENKKDQSQQQNQEQKIPSLSESQINGKQQCSICLIEFISQEKIRQTICNHTFHSQCLNDWLQKNDNCPICRQDFGINQMIEYLTSKKLDLIQDQIEKDNINSIKEQLLSKLQKVEVFELERQEFLNFIQQSLIGQSSPHKIKSKKFEQKELKNVQQDSSKIQFFRDTEQSTFQSKIQSPQFSPIKQQSQMLTESSPENNKDYSQFNIMTSLSQDYSNKHLNSSQKFQNQFCDSVESPKTPQRYNNLEYKTKLQSKYQQMAYQKASQFKRGQSQNKDDIKDDDNNLDEPNENNYQENRQNFNLFKSNSENVLETLPPSKIIMEVLQTKYYIFKVALMFNNKQKVNNWINLHRQLKKEEKHENIPTFSQSILNFEMDFKQNNQQNIDYLIIQITISSIQYSVSQFIACLNFNQSALQQYSYVASGNYSCEYTDSEATQQQLNQHLLILDKKDDYFNFTSTFLTIFYQIQPNDTTAYPQQLKYPISYTVLAYQQEQYPCHSGCSQKGICNGLTGTCSCQQEFYGSDCSVKPKTLILDQAQQLTLSPTLQNYYIINLEKIITLQKYIFGIILTNQKIPVLQSNKNTFIIQTDYQLNIKEICQEYKLQSISSSDSSMCQMILGMTTQSINQIHQEISIKLCNQQYDVDASQQNQTTQLSIKQVIIIVTSYTKRRAQMQNNNNSNNNNQIQQVFNQVVQNGEQKQDYLQSKKLILFKQFLPLLQFENYIQTAQINLQQQANNTHNEIHSCSICLIEFSRQDEVRQTICKHIFHSECLMGWISKHENCPLCRQSLDIGDIIDYIVVQKLGENLSDQDRDYIYQQQKKIQELIFDKQNYLSRIEQSDLLNIFYFFLPLQSLNQNQFSQLKGEKNINQISQQIINLNQQQDDIISESTNFYQGNQSPVSLLNNNQFKELYFKSDNQKKSKKPDCNNQLDKQQQNQNEQIQIK